MSGYQFAHIGTYSRKGNGQQRSVFEICAEAARLEGHHPHVEAPLPPTLIAGEFRPEDVPAEIDRRIAGAKRSAKGRSKQDRLIIRIDTHVLDAQVYSHPIYTRAAPIDHVGEERPCMENAADLEAYVRWRDLTVKFAFADAKRRGVEVLSIVEHLDEEHPHIHVLCVPLNPQLNAKHSHPGHAAAARRKKQAEKHAPLVESLSEGALKGPKAIKPDRSGRRRGIDIGRRAAAPPARQKQKGEDLSREQLIKRIGDRAYRAEMRAWQTSYYQEVGISAGLTRHGPRRLRMPRNEWRHWKQHAEAVAELEQVRVMNEERATVAHAQQIEAEAAAAEALRAIGPDSVLRQTLDDFCREAAKELSEARSKTTQLQAEHDGLVPDLARKQAELHDVSRAVEAAEKSLAGLQAEELAARNRVGDLQTLRANADHAETRMRKAKQERALAEAVRDEALRAQRAAEDAIYAAMGKQQALDAAAYHQQVSLDDHQQLLENWSADLNDASAAAAKEATRLATREAAVELKLEAIDLILSGDISENKGQLTLSENVSEQQRAGLQSVGEWLSRAADHVQKGIEKEVSRRVNDAADAITATVGAWSSGIVLRVVRQEGVLPHFDMEGHEQSKQEFSDATNEWRELSAYVLDYLPDLDAIRKANNRAANLEKILDEAERREANDYSRLVIQLRGRRQLE